MLLNEVRRPPTAEQQAAAEQYRAWDAARWADHRAARTDDYAPYGMSCARCGGTPNGQSWRGFVGQCACGGVA